MGNAFGRQLPSCEALGECGLSPVAWEYFAFRVLNMKRAGVISVHGIDVPKRGSGDFSYSNAGSVVVLQDETTDTKRTHHGYPYCSRPHGVHGMATQRELRVLVATDGSRHAQAAVTTTLHFPWPARTKVRVISARRTGADYRMSILLSALDRGAEKAAESARRTLSRRWPDLEIELLDKTPVEGILGEAERFRADVIVVGWRGHGAVRRLLMGSVSRGVVRGAKCAVPRGRGGRSAHAPSSSVSTDLEPARRALAFIGRLVPPRGGRVTLVSAVELLTAPSRGRVPGAASIAMKSDARTRFELERRRKSSIVRRPDSNALDGGRGPCSSMANRCAISSVLSQRVARNCSSSGRGDQRRPVLAVRQCR